MSTPVIIDIIVASALVIFAAWGAHSGLFRSLAGFVIVIVALVGAGMISSTFTEPVTRYIQPLIEKHIEERVDAAVSSQTAGETPSVGAGTETEEAPNVGSSESGQLLERLGLDGTVTKSLNQKVQEQMKETGESVATAVADSLAKTIVSAVLFTLSFLVLTLLLRVLMHAMDLVLRLPGLHMLNAMGGALFGLAEGMLFLFLAVWILRRFGVSFDTELIGSTHVLRFFTTNTPLDILSFL